MSQIATVPRHAAQHLAMTMLGGKTTWAGVEPRPYGKADCRLETVDWGYGEEPTRRGAVIPAPAFDVK